MTCIFYNIFAVPSLRRRFRHNIHLQLRILRRDIGRFQAEFFADGAAALGDGAGFVEGDFAVAALAAEAAVAADDELLGGEVR